MRQFMVMSILLGIVSLQANALTPTESEAQAKAVMGSVYGSFVKIIPYVYSDTSKIESLKLEKNKKEKEELVKNLTDISDFFKGAKHVEFFQKPGFKPSLESINEHLDQTLMSINAHNFLFAGKRLNTLAALCVSCHSQLSSESVKNAFGDEINKSKRDNFDSDYGYGNYLFLVRRFTEAKVYLERGIDESLKKVGDATKGISASERDFNFELFSALRRLISLHTKVQFNFPMAQAFIKKYQNDKRLTGLSRETLNQWGKDLDRWKKFDPSSVKNISSFIKENLTPLEFDKVQLTNGDKDVTLLVSAGVLTKFLSQNPNSDLAPEILYWLAIAERRLSHTYFFSLSDLYLKDCVKKYPTSPYAKKCYQEYAENIEFGFSGSGGVDIPADEKRELDKLKSYLK